ncbi:uncharacterized protein LOC125944449 [Dermacentor silvarum]|uniref:uncharacterized protein LOC125944449 n=1 Tax=Dermacentor silvarum TaxID=543639 RepID=UPI0021007269|nr:uncharacterized protein LOC125944449 [Dermacentor silvarum]
MFIISSASSSSSLVGTHLETDLCLECDRSTASSGRIKGRVNVTSQVVEAAPRSPVLCSPALPPGASLRSPFVPAVRQHAAGRAIWHFTISAPPATASPSWIVSGPQRDPHLFAGFRGEDVENWLDNYDRVSSANHWDEVMKLCYVSFYLTGVAKTWFFNHEIDLTDWSSFKQQLRQVFGTPAVRSAIAKKILDTRKQQLGESYTSYIEDVLALCRRVNAYMAESDRVRHIFEGIGPLSFNVLAIKDPATVADIVATCQRLDELESVRLPPPDTPDNNPTTDPSLRAMVRAIVREDLQSLGFSAGPIPAHAPSTTLRDIVKEELASMAGTVYMDPLVPRPPPAYTQVATVVPALVPSMPPKPTQTHLASMSTSTSNQPYFPPWRPTRPIDLFTNRRLSSAICRHGRRLASEHVMPPFWSVRLARAGRPHIGFVISALHYFDCFLPLRLSCAA